jgi:hypothetical protein
MYSRPSSPNGLPVDRGIAIEEASLMAGLFGGLVRLNAWAAQIIRFIALLGVVIAGVVVIVLGGRGESFSLRHTLLLLLVLALFSCLLVSIALLVMSSLGAS